MARRYRAPRTIYQKAEHIKLDADHSFDTFLYVRRVELSLAMIVILCIAQINLTIKDVRLRPSIDAGDVFGMSSPATRVLKLNDPYEARMPEPSTNPDNNLPMNPALWSYLRKGLNYVEASGEEYPPDFLHPGGKAYGPLALTPIAIEDVIQHCEPLARYAVSDVLSDPELYEEFARSYADLLLCHYLGLEYWNMPQENVFEILQKAWLFGPGLYKKGYSTPPSRQRNSQLYIAKMR